METFSLRGLALLPPPRPFSGNSLHFQQNNNNNNNNNNLQMGFNKVMIKSTSPSSSKISVSRRDSYDYEDQFHQGRINNNKNKIVDENMIVLRLRIHEMKMLEKEYDNDENEHEHNPSDKWMKWEKYYYENDYGSDVCEALGFLQSKLMDTRPSFALAMAVVVLLSVPTSLAVAAFHLMEFAKLLLANLAAF